MSDDKTGVNVRVGRPWLMAGLIGVGVVLAAVIAVAIGAGIGQGRNASAEGQPSWHSPTPAALVSVNGSMRVPLGRAAGKDAIGQACTVGFQFADIHPGAQVTITDAGGKVLAVAALDKGAIVADDALGGAGYCRFPFTAQVASGVGPYGFEIGTHGVVRFPESTVHKADMTLG